MLLVGGLFALALAMCGAGYGRQLLLGRRMGDGRRRLRRHLHRRGLRRGLGAGRGSPARPRAGLGDDRPVAHPGGRRAARRLDRLDDRLARLEHLRRRRWRWPAALGLFVTAGRGGGTAGPWRAGHRCARRCRRTCSALLGIGISERICYGLATIYFATFLQAIYGLSLGATALPLVIFALGNIAGTVLGGQVADRLRDRLLTFAVAMALSGVAALGLFMWHPAPAVSVALGFVYTFMNALGRPSYMAALASVPDNVRGTVLGLNGTSASVGWVGAAALGALIISTVGFEGFGPLAALLGLLGALGALASRRGEDFYLRLFYR